jgi:PEP-CTERM motif
MYGSAPSLNSVRLVRSAQRALPLACPATWAVLNDGDYDDMVIGVKVTAAIPEPETYALLLAGLGAVAFVVRRRRPKD